MAQKRQEAENLLVSFFNETVSKNSYRQNTDDEFDPDTELTQEQVSKMAEASNQAILEKDADSKFSFRKITLVALFFLLGFQILFMNAIVGWLFFSQTFEHDLFFKLSEGALAHLCEVAKWYTTAVLAELLAAFLYIVKAVFETPLRGLFSLKKRKK